MVVVKRKIARRSKLFFLGKLDFGHFKMSKMSVGIQECFSVRAASMAAQVGRFLHVARVRRLRDP